MGFFLLCLAGLPPGIIGLFAKVTVFSSAVDAGLGWLAVVMAVNVVIALVLLPAVDRDPLPRPEGAADGSHGERRGGRRGGSCGQKARPGPADRGHRRSPPSSASSSPAVPQLVLRFAATNLF